MRYQMAFLGILVLAATAPLAGQQPPQAPIRLGMIGLDTSHVIAFTKQINDPERNYPCRIVAGFPGGSPDFAPSSSRVEQYTKQLREQFGLEIVDSIEQLCGKVDGVLLESVEGRPHLGQIRPVLQAKKPVFIDKPMAGDLADVLEIFRLAKEHGVPCWSSSSLRYNPETYGMRRNAQVGEVIGCVAYGPCAIETVMPDLYWYGVHGVETLFTIMGPGCQSVRRIHTADTDEVVGLWADGRVGTYRGLRRGQKGFGALVFGSKTIHHIDRYVGYDPLVEQIVTFFQTNQVPVAPEETIEIFAFMTAADVSKQQNGAAVSLESVLQAAKEKNRLRRGTPASLSAP
ncbi:MAG: Gfo/Idh/MocA family oxidoreductase [Sedimentisphaerales bacterium]|nr:Gfo/Idh/MocA family oxidoreductase [Sedimentisphaerales bacterium]